MGKKKSTSESRIFACDFETTTESYSTEETKVWSFQVSELGTEDVEIFGSIEEFYKWCCNYETGADKLLYFHNEKFDGEFIISYLLRSGYKTHYSKKTKKPAAPFELFRECCLYEKKMTYLISDLGQWYYIAFLAGICRIEVRDSLKLLPFSLEKVGKDFCVKHKKTHMNYNKTSLSECSESDIEYLKNDVLVLNEALSGMLGITEIEGNPFDPIDTITIGGACLKKMKALNYGEWGKLFPKLNNIELSDDYGAGNADEYIRKAYRGGFVYVAEKYRGSVLNDGYTADINSSYPYSMHSCCEQPLPVGKPVFKKGKFNDKDLESKARYLYIRLRCHFELKEGYVPTIQVKKDLRYSPREYLKTSDIITRDKIIHATVELTLAEQDYKLLMKHYDVTELEYLDYCVFATASGVFDSYVNEMMEIKANSTGCTRSTAKLYVNNGYGQMSKSDRSSYKIAELDPVTEIVQYRIIEDHTKKVEHIGCGAAITANSRYYLINTIQDNYDSFVYCDTDSLHCIGKPEDFKGKTHKSDLGAFKIEHTWTQGYFERAKTYIEKVEDGSYNICCAGLPDRCKKLFALSLTGKQNFSGWINEDGQHESWTEAEAEFLFNDDMTPIVRTISDFKAGLKVPSKLLPKRVKGGVILQDAWFTMK